MDILHILREGGKTGDEVESECGCGGSTVRRNLKILRDAEIVERRDGSYQIPDEKRFLVEALLETSDLFDTYEDNGYYWGSHDISQIPEEFREGLGALQGGEVVGGTTANPRAGLERYCEMVRESSWVKGVTPALVPETEGVFLEMVERGEQVDVIATEGVVSMLRERYGERMTDAIRNGNLRISICDEVNLGLTVTDTFMRLVLYRDDGTYDLNTFFFSTEPEARDWAERLYADFLSRATEPITF